MSTTTTIDPILGTIVIEPDAAQLLRDCGVQLWDCLRSHLDGDLGDTTVAGTSERAALWSEGRVCSRYAIGKGWLDIATDLDQGVTRLTVPYGGEG